MYLVKYIHSFYLNVGKPGFLEGSCEHRIKHAGTLVEFQLKHLTLTSEKELHGGVL